MLKVISSALLSASLLVTPIVPTETPEKPTALNTDLCPHEHTPAEPVTTSEALAPGEVAPPVPPVTYTGECGVSAPAGFELSDDVVASSWIVFDVNTGKVVAMKDPHGRYRPASVIKVLIALEAIDKLDPDQKIPVSEFAASQEGSAVGIGASGEYTAQDLINGLLLASGNDAAQALAESLVDSEEELFEVLQERADSLGATSTVVTSYSGLDAPGQMTSATDLALFYQEAYANPVFRETIATPMVEFPGYGEYPAFEVWNDNQLLLNDPDGIGGKTGFTDDANHTFVGALERDGRMLAAVVLDTTVEEKRAWEQAQILLHEAYSVPTGEGVTDLTTLAGIAPPKEENDPIAASPKPPAGVAADEIVGYGIIGLIVLGLFGAGAFVLIRRSPRPRK